MAITTKSRTFSAPLNYCLSCPTTFYSLLFSARKQQTPIPLCPPQLLVILLLSVSLSVLRSFVQHCTPKVHRACSRRDPGPLYCEILHCVVMHILSVQQLFSMDIVSTFQLCWKLLLSRFTYTLSCHVFVCTCNQERCCCIP